MQDINVFRDSTLEVKLSKYKIFYVKKPTQRMIIEYQHIVDDAKNKNHNINYNYNLLQNSFKFITKVLNNNANNKTIPIKKVKKFFANPIMRLAFFATFTNYINEILSDKILDIPSLPYKTHYEGELKMIYKRENTIISDVSRVAHYCNMTIDEALDLPCDVFADSLKQSVVDTLINSEIGRKYLDDVAINQQTEPDLEGLRRAGLLKG